ncbi:flagellar basal body-associated FliL family protein [Desulfobotulus sp.]|jgi:flagellar basal body-associated protein FliL|uniref:flagellar basal body-associated FliL family protein n=1 Tax=Desulfobotulus sp. TaxID=1940337 RepID=UPI002A35AD6A|nr:flagellar basal body-associated FliL family protein [Desulfobotulus sp.]MDY0164034.1 flagellar basal body-associated FliL family protein [Desulfobotulus sp.]
MAKKTDQTPETKKKTGSGRKEGQGLKMKRPPRWVLLLLVFVGVLVVGTMLAFFLFAGKKEPEPVVEIAMPESPDRIPGLWQLPVMEIPVRVEGEIRLPLRLGIAILAAEGPDTMVALLRQREAITRAIRSHVEKGKAEDWESVAGKLRLKYDLTTIVSGVGGASHVRALYITDYMILWPI